MAIIEDNKHFYVGLKAFIGKNGRLLVVRESEEFDEGGMWELPGGRIGNDESENTFHSVLLREVNEECGDVEIRIGEIIGVFRRRFANGEWVILVGYDCDYISGEISLSEEHCEYKWIGPEDVDGCVFVNGYKEAVVDYFRRSINV